MDGNRVDLIAEPHRARVALSPIRCELLRRLRKPASATQLAAALDLSRQRVNYHLRTLEKAGLVRLFEERARRGCVERVMIAAADTFVIDPTLTGGTSPAAQDAFAAQRLITTGAEIVRDVARMQAVSDREGKRLLTFSIRTEVRLARPADLEGFVDELSAAVARVVRRFDRPRSGRPYRVVTGGYPEPVGKKPRRKP